ncbi:MAG: magnesium transporter [Candidatus Eisenbacteria bacterium]|nr:magnesium transporter [Candidatus Latescibacterota bacterium]MBD3300907.1 magnesium transporter [Candidatus Eisenbacteria bacterium]
MDERNQANAIPPEEEIPPWDRLSDLIQAGDSEAIEQFVDALPLGEIARILSRLDEEDRGRFLQILPPETVAEILEQIPEVQAVDLIEQLDHDVAAAILNELPSDEQADLIGDLEDQDAEAILREMEPEESRDARALSRYEDDVAGGLMITEYLSYPESATVADVVNDLRRNAEEYQDYHVQYAYVTTTGGRLAGVLQLRELFLSADAKRISDLMIRDPRTVPDQAGLEELEDLFDRYPFFGLPVVDAHGRLVGVVQRESVDEAVAERAGSDYRKSQGIVGGEELRTMPLFLRSRRRLSWLSVNILLNVIAASVIAFYQDTLASVIALAVFLPIISDMSGCSGNQAVAVSMRELTLGVVKPAEVALVWGKEVLVGLVNGMALGALIGLVAWLWKGNVFLGLVVGGAMAVNTIVAVSIGGTIPLILKRLEMDPALASGPILTTITDMCGFFVVLSLATVLLPYLTG